MATIAAATLTAAAAAPAHAAAGGPNLALGKAATASSANGIHTAGILNDGSQDSYWESANNAFPQWAQIDLGASTSTDQIVLKLPASRGSWTQTLSVQGSPDGISFSTIVTSAGYTFNPTVTINFPATNTRYVRVNITANPGWPAAQISEFEIYGTATSTGNLALNKPTAESSHTQTYASSNVVDGNQASYWESANNAFPQWVQVDLGASVAVNKVILKIPSGWQARTQTLSVQGSTNGSTFTDIVASAGYNFNPTVTINFNTATTRYVRIHITANTVWPAGQLSELEVYGSGAGDTEPPTAPTNLSYTQPASGHIKLTWNASTDNVGVTAYDIYANNSLRVSVNGSTLTYTDTQPDTLTVSYFVRARDAAGNQSPNSNTVKRIGSGGGGTNLALGKPITSSGYTHIYAPENANDNDLTSYWEGSGPYPQTLTVHLGANAVLNQIVLKLNPDASWATRTQTVRVLGRGQSGGNYTQLVASASYMFNPATGNSVTIPVSATAADVQLEFTANTGAPGGQVAEFQVFGTPAPNPDLTITAASWSPASPVESDAITLSATVRNIGDLGSGATTVNFYLDTTKVGTGNVPALAAGASTTVTVNIGTRAAGTYQLAAKVNEDDSVIEKDMTNNSYTNPNPMTVTPVQSSDLVAKPVAWSPNNPQAGNTVTFSVGIKNQGNIDSASGSHGITLTLLNATGGTVITRTGSYNGVIAAGQTASPVNLGTWTAVNGRYTVRVVLAADANEVPVKQGNNTSEQPLFVGRGANLPYDMYEAEDGQTGGGATVIGPNRTIGDLAGEASVRRAVTLSSTGSYVQWTTRAATNTLVTRFSIPDAPGGGGISSNLSIYVNGTLHRTIPLNSRYAWLYGAEASPGNSPSAGAPRHIYDEANIMLNSTIPQGSTIRLQRDSGQSVATIDFVNLELVSPRANPDPARYKVPAGFSHQDVQNALDAVRMDTTGAIIGVYLPAGTYSTSQKFQIYGKAVNVVGAGMWYTRFETPQVQENTDAGFRVETTANGSRFEDLAFFGNYTSRIDGPGKVWGELQNNQNLTINRTWVEHTIVAYWGVHNNNITITNSRFRNTFADAVNFTNDTTNSLVSNNEARGNGDDGFALFSATDSGGSVGNNGNVFENLSATLQWRAAGVAVYGGFNNTFRNLYIADQLTYSGLTVSSLNFGYPFVGFAPTTRIEGVSLIRSGGHFWGNQTFPAIWCFAATHAFRALRFTDIDIVDPTYSGIMFQTKYPEQTPVTDTIFTNVSISGAQRSGDAFDAKSGFGIWANEMPEAGQGPARGSVTFNNLRFSNNHTNVQNLTTTFTITINP
ncbi:MAG: discoidin domain-containing protein [Micromonosporaceae bacterium]